MALYTPGPLAGQISGRVGSSIFSHNRGGTYIRNGTIPTKVLSPYAMNMKAIITELSQDWAGITAAAAQAWRTWAQQNPITNRLGRQSTLAPHVAYIQLNSRLLLAGDTKIGLPPIIPAPQPLDTITPTADIGLGDVELAFTPTPPDAGIRIWLQAALVDNANITYVENLWKFLVAGVAAAASPLNFETELGLRFGTPQVGQYVHVLASQFDSATGLLSAPVRSGCLVTTT